jgi:hypothetical protein
MSYILFVVVNIPELEFSNIQYKGYNRVGIGVSYLPARLHRLAELIYWNQFLGSLKVVSSEKVGGSRVTSTLGTWYGGVVMGVLLSFNEAAILCIDFNNALSQQQNIIVFAANNSRCCKCHVAPTILL